MAQHVPLLIEAFGTPSDGKAFTSAFPPALIDKEIMRKIAEKCRSRGVTINAVLNTALVKVVRDAGLKRSNYLISSRHPVDSRRQMRKGTQPFLGHDGIPFSQATATLHNVKNNFWGYVKNLDTELRDKLKRNTMCEERVLNAMLRPEGYTHKAYYSQPVPPCYDYIFTNLYSPHASIQGIRKFVQITSILNHSNIHKAYYPLGLGLSSFCGQVPLVRLYSTARISKEVAGRYFDKTLADLHDISRPLM